MLIYCSALASPTARLEHVTRELSDGRIPLDAQTNAYSHVCTHVCIHTCICPFPYTRACECPENASGSDQVPRRCGRLSREATGALHCGQRHPWPLVFAFRVWAGEEYVTWPSSAQFSVVYQNYYDYPHCCDPETV